MSRFAISALMLSAVMLLSGAARAMDIVQYDQMTNQDRQAFLDSLSRYAETVLNQEGRSDDASKVHHLFYYISPDSDLSLGVGEFELNLAAQRVRNVQQHIKNNDAP